MPISLLWHHNVKRSLNGSFIPTAKYFFTGLQKTDGCVYCAWNASISSREKKWRYKSMYKKLHNLYHLISNELIIEWMGYVYPIKRWKDWCNNRQDLFLLRLKKKNKLARHNGTHYSIQIKWKEGYAHCQVLNMTCNFRRHRHGSAQNNRINGYVLVYFRQPSVNY